MKKTITIIGGIIGAFILMGIGAAIGSPPESETTAAVVTVTPAPVETQVETVVETVVETTPQVCLDALDEGEVVIAAAAVGFGLFGEFAGLSAEAVGAAAEWDIATLDRLTIEIGGVADNLSAQTDIVTASNYETLAAACRNGS